MANSSEETDALRKDLDQLRQDISALKESVKSDSYSQVQAGMSRARDQFGNLCSEAEARPLAALATAFGVGVLLGTLFKR